MKPDDKRCATFVTEPNGIRFGFWATMRPLTGGWGSGQVHQRLVAAFGPTDAIFGHTDGETLGATIIDLKMGFNWRSLPFVDSHFAFGYWDPPYFVLDDNGKATLKPCLYRREGMEIWRTCRRLAILHTYVWPHAWLKNAERESMVAITMGPMKAVRLLQVFRKTDE